MKKIFFSLTLLINSTTILAAATPVQIKIQWEYKDFSLPMTIFEVKNMPQLWETKNVPSLSAAPLDRPIEGSTIFLIPGQKKRFALLIQNTTNESKFFFAAPHTIKPVEHSLGFKFKCLCINHAFQINPKEFWYRIVEFKLSEGFVGQELVVTHSIVGIDQKRASSAAKEPIQHEF